MSKEDRKQLDAPSRRMPGTFESSVSPMRGLSEQYKGVVVELEMKPGTTAKLGGRVVPR